MRAHHGCDGFDFPSEFLPLFDSCIDPLLVVDGNIAGVLKFQGFYFCHVRWLFGLGVMRRKRCRRVRVATVLCQVFVLFLVMSRAGGVNRTAFADRFLLRARNGVYRARDSENWLGCSRLGFWDLCGAGRDGVVSERSLNDVASQSICHFPLGSCAPNNGIHCTGHPRCKRE